MRGVYCNLYVPRPKPLWGVRSWGHTLWVFRTRPIPLFHSSSSSPSSSWQLYVFHQRAWNQRWMMDGEKEQTKKLEEWGWTPTCARGECGLGRSGECSRSGGGWMRERRSEDEPKRVRFHVAVQGRLWGGWVKAQDYWNGEWVTEWVRLFPGEGYLVTVETIKRATPKFYYTRSDG